MILQVHGQDKLAQIITPIKSESGQKLWTNWGCNYHSHDHLIYPFFSSTTVINGRNKIIYKYYFVDEQQYQFLTSLAISSSTSVPVNCLDII